MTWEDRLEKEQPFIDKYEEEFEKNGIENLEIKDRNIPMYLEIKGNA